MNLRTAIDKYLEVKQHTNLSEGTILQYTYHLNRFLQTIGNKELRDITFDDIMNCLTPRKSAAYEQIKVSLLKEFFKMFGFLELADKIPYPKSEVKEVSPVYEEELEVILKERCTTKQDKALILLMVSSGLRASEVIELRVEDLDFDKLVGRVWGKGKKRSERPDFFPFSKDTREAMVEYLNGRDSGHVFLNNGKKWTYWCFWNYFKTKFGIRPHQLRHSFCSIYSKKLPPIILQRLARHKSFETTKRYINPDMDKMIEEYRKVENVKKLIKK